MNEKIESKYTASDIIKIFVEKHFTTYTSMVMKSHFYSDFEPNPFHMEGGVWTHTMMVLKEAENASDVMKLAALCHDIGKAYVSEDKHEKKRRRFTNHEAVSTFHAKEVLESYDLTKEEKHRILFIVANHGSFYNFFEEGRIPEKNYTKFTERFTYEQFLDLSEFYRYDHNGRFHVGESDRCNDDVYKDFKKILNIMRSEHVAFKSQTNTEKTITVLVGPPRAGKSTWVENNVNEALVISRDDLVMKHGEGKTYSECWSSISQEKHKELDKEIQSMFQNAVKTGHDIVIDMTNMSKKSRRKWLANTKDYHKKSVVFIESPSCLISRNTPEKHIPLKVTDMMMRNFVWPQHDEFDHVELYHEAV